MIHLLFKRSPIALAFLLLFCNKMDGQNLVLNPGFESFITCPGFGQFSNVYISNWNKPTIASSDYYHYNCAGINPTVQAPRNGEAYAGIIAYNFGTEYREYVTGTLSAPLVAGQTYNVEFYVSLNDGYIQAITELGAYLSNAAPGPFSNVLHINVIPQVENTAGTITDTSVWKKVSGQIVAAGGEQFITIGNFHNDTTTTITQPGTSGSYGAYYFVDDVAVTLDSTTSITSILNSDDPKIFLSDDNFLIVQIPNSTQLSTPLLLRCYDMKGRLVMMEELQSNLSKIKLGQLKSQIYIFSIINSSGKLWSKRIVMMD
jgi:hypothetical protein